MNLKFCITLGSGGGFDYTTFFATWIWPLLTAIIGGIISGIIAIFAVNLLQKPKLIVSLAEDRYDGRALAHYVHLSILNRKSLCHRLLGGGTAVNCKCTLTLDRRSFITKWAAREPWGTQILPDPSGRIIPVHILDQQHIDQAKFELLRPGEQKLVDVAVRLKGDSSCYIHQPENFSDPNYRPMTNEVQTGIHQVTAILEYDGGSADPFHFRIINEKGDSPGLLRLEV